jgi:hypothetical protein
MWTVAFSVSSFRRKLKLSSDVQMPDSITWKGTESGIYSAKGTYDLLCQGSINWSTCKPIWRSYAPLKCNFLGGWLWGTGSDLLGHSKNKIHRENTMKSRVCLPTCKEHIILKRTETKLEKKNACTFIQVPKSWKCALKVLHTQMKTSTLMYTRHEHKQLRHQSDSIT